MYESKKVTSSKQADVQMKWGLKIPLRDGIYLNATLYLPRNQEKPAPAIFTHTPYVGQTYHDYALYFAEHGYPFLTVDVRGRGNSQGEFHPANEGRDSNDVVEFIARQRYCNGKVAMWGGSYSGYVQWAAIKKPSPHLATIVPVASPYRGVDSPARNNIFIPYTMRWLTLISGRTSQDKIFADDRSFWARQFRLWFESGAAFRTLDAFVGNPSPLFQEWISHPEVDSYWDSYNPTAEEYSKLCMPVLTITGIYDGDQPGALMHYRQHMRSASAENRTSHYLVIGPWDHAGTRAPKAEFGGIRVGPAALIDLRQLHVGWYDWTMRGGPRPVFLRNNVAYYVMGSEQWRYADTLEAVTAYSKPLYLHSVSNPTDVFQSGSLLPQCSPGSESDCYVYDPRDVSSAELESDVDPDSLVDQRLVYASWGKRLVYQSAPFDESVEISGFFSLSVWISIDQPDTDFRAWIYEVALDGTSILLTTDSLRARYRESLREAKLIRTTEPLHYAFERFMFVSRLIGKGSRLRLVIGAINSIHSQKNYNSGGAVSDESMADARPVTVRLFHDESRPSALHVPYGCRVDDAPQAE